MPVRGPVRRRDARGLGIAFLIFSLVHTPLPQPDFHNIRHHDAPGEVCEHHDHLLLWHPGASGAQDVALLHWHWFWPAPDRPGPPLEGEGHAVHAHVADWFASTWDDGPRVVPDDHSRLIPRPDSSPGSPALLDSLAGWSDAPASPGRSRPSALGATFARGVPLTALLQRWSC